jgi:hypothetical protein
MLDARYAGFIRHGSRLVRGPARAAGALCSVMSRYGAGGGTHRRVLNDWSLGGCPPSFGPGSVISLG